MEPENRSNKVQKLPAAVGVRDVAVLSIAAGLIAVGLISYYSTLRVGDVLGIIMMIAAILVTFDLGVTYGYKYE